MRKRKTEGLRRRSQPRAGRGERDGQEQGQRSQNQMSPSTVSAEGIRRWIAAMYSRIPPHLLGRRRMIIPIDFPHKNSALRSEM